MQATGQGQSWKLDSGADSGLATRRPMQWPTNRILMIVAWSAFPSSHLGSLSLSYTLTPQAFSGRSGHNQFLARFFLFSLSLSLCLFSVALAWLGPRSRMIVPCDPWNEFCNVFVCVSVSLSVCLSVRGACRGQGCWPNEITNTFNGERAAAEPQSQSQKLHRISYS